MKIVAACGVAVIALLAPAAAQAQLTWTKPQVVSTDELNAEYPKVGIADNGQGVMVWRTDNGATWSIEAAYRGPGQNFSVPVPLGDEGYGVAGLELAVDPQGNAVAVWERSIPGGYEVRGAFRPAGGQFGTPQTISGAGESGLAPQVAIDSKGNALVVYDAAVLHDISSDFVVRAAFRPAGGSFVSEGPVSQVASNVANRPRVAFDASGNAVAIWSRRFGAPNNEERVEAAYRAAGGSFGTPQTLSLGPESSEYPTAAFDGTGNIFAAWSRRIGTDAQIQRAFAPVGQPFGEPRSLTREDLDAFFPELAVDAAGNAVMVYEQQMEEGPDYRVHSTYRPVGGDFGPSVPIPGSGSEGRLPQIAGDARGNAVATWLVDDGGDGRAEASYRPAGASSGFGPPKRLSEYVNEQGVNEFEGWFFNEYYVSGVPDVDMTAGGVAVAVWPQVDGANVRVLASFGLPPGVTQPPPPPPPAPSAPNVIQPAEPFKRSRAVVVTANVTGAIDRLVWDLDGRVNPVGTVVDGQLQRSVRFRPDPGGKFRVKVTAVGPGGSSTFSRSFVAPKGLQGEDVERVRRGLGDTDSPRVFAVGHANVLLGKASASAAAKGCGPTAIFSGQLKLEGCFSPVEALGDIPDAERGVLDSVARELKLEGARTELMRTAVELTDGYVARGRTLMNDVWPVDPSGGAAIAAFTQAKALASSRADLRVGGIPIDPSGRGMLLKLNPKSGDIPLGALPRPPGLPSIGGFKLVGDFNVDLERREARIKAHLRLPSFLKKAGVDIQNEVRLRATPSELIIDEIRIGPINVNMGALAVDAFQVVYRRAPDEWQGQGKACVVRGVCLDMVPPNGQVKIKNGRLDFAGASLHFPFPGIPLFTGVNLERIGFGFGLDPTRFTGNARLSFAKLLVIDGRMVIAFPNHQTPFFLKRDEVGNDFPAHLYTYRYIGSPTIGISAGAALRLPAVGEVPFANAYVLYEYPGYLALGGGVSYAFREPITNVALIEVGGRLAGEFNAGNGRFNVDGHVHACVVEVICKGVDGNVSNNGMSVCTTVDGFVHEFHMGGAIRWSPFKFIPYLDDCKWGRFREANVRGARIAQAGGPYSVQVRRGDPSRMVMLTGTDGAPRVRVTGPGGQALDAPQGSGIASSPDGKLRMMRSERAKFVAVGFAGAAPGGYAIEALPGSPAIGDVQESRALPNARASGRVTGKGKRRVLRYRVGRRADQSVSFFEVGPGGTGKQIGATTSRRRGRIGFSPAPGRGRRRVEARFELDGVPAETRVIARFRPPSPRLAKPKRIRVRRKGRAGLRVSWRRVEGASRYEVAVTTARGVQRFRTTRKRSTLVRRIPRTTRGRVSVRAVDRLRQGRPASKRFKRTTRPRLLLRALPRCKVKRRVVCRGGR